MIGQLQTDAYKFLTRIKADSGSIIDEVETRKSIDDSIAQSKEIIDSASLVMIPTGSKSGKLHSLKPTDGTGDFTVARNSVKQVLGKDGYYREVAVNVPALEWSPTANKFGLLIEAQRTNLLTRSWSFLTGLYTTSNTTLLPDSSTASGDVFGSVVTSSGWTNPSARKLVASSPIPRFTRCYFTPALQAGKMYKVNYVVNAITGSFIIAQTAGTDGSTKSISAIGSDFFYTTCTNSTHRLSIYPNSASDITIDIDITSVQEVQGYDCPFVNSTGVNLKRGFKLTATGANGYINLATPLTITAATAYTNSIFVKRLTGTGAVSLIDTNGTDRAITVTSDWQRFTYTATSAGTTGQIGIKLATSGDEVMICQADVVQADAAGSPIFTDGATVTRLADAINKTGIADLIGQTEGTIVIECIITSFSQAGFILTLSNGTSANNLSVYKFADSKIYFDRVSTTQSAYTTKSSAVLTTGRHKIAVAYVSGNTVMYIDGVKSGTTGVETFIFNSLSVLTLGAGYNNSTQFNDNINSIYVIKSRLPDNNLQQLTTL